jgi:HSP20 family protein
LPGLDADSIGITVIGDTMTIRGKRESARSGDYHCRERGDWEFARSVRLPFTVDADATEARYSKGVLSVALRRPEAQKPKKIGVKAA